MQSFVSFAAGVQNIITLKLIAGLVILASILGWLSDRENMNAKSPKKAAFYGSVFAYFVAILPVLGSIIGTLIFGSETFPWYVYALSAVLALAFIANAWNQKASIINKAKLEYVAYEQRYLRINQATNLLLVLVIIAAIK